MPNVIVNTSPIQYLYQLGQLNLLPQLYKKIIIPEAVEKERRKESETLAEIDSIKSDIAALDQ